MTEDVKKTRRASSAATKMAKTAASRSKAVVEESPKARRGRPSTGTAKSSTDRGKAADEALLASGGLILNKVRFSPLAASALTKLVNEAGGERGAQRSAIENAVICAAENLPTPTKKKKIG